MYTSACGIRDPPWRSGYDAMVGSQALVRSFEALTDPIISKRAWSLYKCATLLKDVYGSSATENTLEMFVKRRIFIQGSRRDMT